MRHGELVSISWTSRGDSNFDLTTTKVAGSHTKQPSFNTLGRSPHTFHPTCFVHANAKLIQTLDVKQESCIPLHIIIHACSSDILTPSTHWTVGKIAQFLEKDTLFRTNAAKMHRSIAAKEVHIARYLFWGSGGKVCGYIVVLGGWWQAATAGDAVSLSASTDQPTHWKEQPL